MTITLCNIIPTPAMLNMPYASGSQPGGKLPPGPGVTRRFLGGNEDREKKKKFTVGNAIF